jgi:hypothetical protein
MRIGTCTGLTSVSLLLFLSTCDAGGYGPGITFTVGIHPAVSTTDGFRIRDAGAMLGAAADLFTKKNNHCDDTPVCMTLVTDGTDHGSEWAATTDGHDELLDGEIDTVLDYHPCPFS